MSSEIGDKNDGQSDPPKAPLPERVQLVFAIAGCISVVLLSAAASYRLATGHFSFAQFDFSQLLSLALAIFSVGLSTAFYFKATDTSNKFYDRTFGHTKDLIQALVRIEERFGQMLHDIHEDTAATREHSRSKNEVREVIVRSESTTTQSDVTQPESEEES